MNKLHLDTTKLANAPIKKNILSTFRNTILDKIDDLSRYNNLRLSYTFHSTEFEHVLTLQSRDRWLFSTLKKFLVILEDNQRETVSSPPVIISSTWNNDDTLMYFYKIVEEK